MENMTREEHLIWCKRRAIAEMDYHKDPKKGIISLMSDFRKHPETSGEVMISLCVMMLMTGATKSRQEVLDFINGFN